MTGLGPGGILDPAPGSDDTAEYAPARSRRSAVRTRTFAIAGVAAVLALGVGGAVVFAPDGGGGGKTQNQSQSTKAKAPVVRGDLTVSEELGGVLGFAGTGTVYAQQPESGGGTPPGSGDSGGASAPPGGGTASSPSPSRTPDTKQPGTGRPDDEGLSGPRIFTELPKVGDVVRQGETVYRVNGRPVPLFVGDAPLWRALGKGVANGSDVRILERNLVALGYGKDLQVDDKFTDATAAAVQRWQKALGVPQTGRVDPSAVVVQPGAVRVTALKASVGAPAQGEVAAVSGTNRQVTVPLPVDKQALARKGAKVSVRLPDGRTTPGTVAEIGTVATKNEGDGGGGPPGGGGGKPVIQVTVTLDKPDEAGALDGAPVNVGFTSQSRTNVLSVPVNALVALAEGGYAVEVVEPSSGTSRLVGVTPGLFANGRVEVSGDGLTAGQNVRVPS